MTKRDLTLAKVGRRVARRKRLRSEQEELLLAGKSRSEETVGAVEEQAYLAQNVLLGNPAVQTAQRRSLLWKVGRVQGNQHIQRMLASLNGRPESDGVGHGEHVMVQRQPVTEYTFEDELVTGELHALGPDVSGVDVADDIAGAVNMMRDAWNMIAMRYLSGIDNFAEYMHFPPEAEAQADYLKAAFKFALGSGVGAALDQLPKRFEPIGIAIGLIKDFIEAMVEEHDRAQAAAEQVRVRDYIVSYRAHATDLVTSQLGRLEPLRQSLLAAYQTTLQTASPEEGAQELGTPTATRETAPRRVVTGPGATFLNELRRVAERLHSIAEASTTDLFTQRILEKWVQTRERTAEVEGGEVYMGGRIYLNMKFYKNGSNWTIEERPSIGRLAAPDASRTMDALHRVMQSQGNTINDLDILKVLHVEVEDEIEWGFNDTYSFNIFYRSPDNITEVTTCVPYGVRRETVQRAPRIAEQARSQIDLNEIRVNRLETYE